MKKFIKNKRLTIRLFIGLTLTASCVWLIATVVAWFVVKKEVNDVFDAQQVFFAERLATSDLQNLLLDNQNFYRGGFKAQKRHYDDDALAFAIFSRDGKILLTDGENGDHFRFEDKIGFSESYLINYDDDDDDDDDDKWKIYWQPVGNGELIIAVGQELDYRDDLINKIVFRQMGVWFAGLPILLLVAFAVFYQVLKPIRKLSQNLKNRKVGDVSLLDTNDLPTEILPLVISLNQFFSRTGEQIERERRFVSDAAHELRTPLTALRIQAEVALLVGDDPKKRENALNNITHGIDRATQLIEQLLILSRIDNLKQLDNLSDIHWAELITSTISDVYAHSQKQNIEISFDKQSEPPVKQGQQLLLTQMLRNLLDNAIKYCPPNSTIKVILSKSKVIIEDNGRGVPTEELAKLGQRFYRVAGQNEKGSGLGLSIVRRIAELHNYRFHLENIKDQNQIIGLRAVIELR